MPRYATVVENSSDLDVLKSITMGGAHTGWY